MMLNACGLFLVTYFVQLFLLKTFPVDIFQQIEVMHSEQLVTNCISA